MALLSVNDDPIPTELGRQVIFLVAFEGISRLYIGNNLITSKFDKTFSFPIIVYNFLNYGICAETSLRMALLHIIPVLCKEYSKETYLNKEKSCKRIVEV